MNINSKELKIRLTFRTGTKISSHK